MLFLWTVVCTVSGCRRKWLNLAIVFWVNLVLQYILLTDTCLFLLCFFQLFSSKPGDWLERTSPKWPVLCQLGRKTTTQINHATMSGSLACVHVCAWRACVMCVRDVRVCLVMIISAWSCSGSRLTLTRNHVSLSWEIDAASLVRTTAAISMSISVRIRVSLTMTVCQ